MVKTLLFTCHIRNGGFARFVTRNMLPEECQVFDKRVMFIFHAVSFNLAAG